MALALLPLLPSLSTPAAAIPLDSYEGLLADDPELFGVLPELGAAELAEARRYGQEAKSQLDRGNVLFAIQILEGARRLHPEAAGIQITLGRLYNRIGSYAAAEQVAN